MTAFHETQVSSWSQSKKDHKGDEDALFRRIWKAKVQNTLGKARQRQNPNGVNVIIAMERGKEKEKLSALARRISGRVCQVLAERGFKFDFEIDQTDDVVSASVHIHTLHRLVLKSKAA